MFKSVASAVAGAVIAGSVAFALPAWAAGGYPPYGSVKDAPAPVYVPPPITWSGVYVGLHAGYAWGDAEWNFRNVSYFNDAIGDRIGHDPEGWLVGGQLGFNHQTGRVVWGLEGTLAGADISDTSRSPFVVTDRFKTDIDMTWSVTGRLGYDWGGLLTYVKAGYAGATAEITARDPNLLVTARKDATYNGWTIGAGVEFLVSPNVVLGVEYGYSDLGSASHRTLDTDDNLFRVHNDLTMHAVTARLSYKFDRDRYVISPFK